MIGKFYKLLNSNHFYNSSNLIHTQYKYFKHTSTKIHKFVNNSLQIISTSQHKSYIHNFQIFETILKHKIISLHINTIWIIQSVYYNLSFTKWVTTTFLQQIWIITKERNKIPKTKNSGNSRRFSNLQNKQHKERNNGG